MTQATTQPSITSRTIAVEHIRISSGRPFAEVRRRLEGTVPKLDTSIAEALRSGDQKRTKDYEKNGPKLSIFGERDHGACCRSREAHATRCNMTSAIPSRPRR
jgi:hypothetical protein